MKIYSLVFLYLFLLKTCYCARILVFLPFSTNWSHQMQYEKLWQALAIKGHQIDVYTFIPPRQNVTNPNYVCFQKKQKANTFNPADTNSLTVVHESLKFGNICLKRLHHAYNTNEFKNLMTTHIQYDLVITETFFSMESTVALGYRFNAPTISLSSFGTTEQSMDMFGNPNLSSFMADYRLPYTDQMSFFARLKNFITILTTKLVKYFYYLPKQQSLVDQYFGRDYPSLTDMLKNISLELLYINHAVHIPMSLVPNMIPVGGIHLDKVEKLPENLTTLMDAATNGFIYMSFGSIVNPTILSPDQKQMFINLFQRINIPIFWKINLEEDPILSTKNLPNNVFVQHWFPQAGILAHPNCLLFITHGGMNSVMEATSAGVPILGMPFFGDQSYNLARVNQRGYGLVFDWSRITAKKLSEGIQTIISDSKFKENALKWSRVFNDNLKSPLETAIYWVEYVLRHKGAHHLSATSRHMSWFTLYSVDVIAFNLGIVFSVCKLVTLIWNSLRRNSNYQLKEK